MRAVLMDSSAFLSLEDPAERSHSTSRTALQELVGSRTALFTTNFVFDETYTLLMTRLGRDRAVRWGDRFKQGSLVQLLRVELDHEERAWEIILAFADKSFSYTDATTFAVAESLGIEKAFSLDRHFRQYGAFRVVP